MSTRQKDWAAARLFPLSVRASLCAIFRYPRVRHLASRFSPRLSGPLVFFLFLSVVNLVFVKKMGNLFIGVDRCALCVVCRKWITYGKCSGKCRCKNTTCDVMLHAYTLHTKDAKCTKCRCPMKSSGRGGGQSGTRIRWGRCDLLYFFLVLVLVIWYLGCI